MEESLVIVGEIMAGDIRDAMARASELFEPNAESTQKAKVRDPMRRGKSNGKSGMRNEPFRWTGHMIKSVSYELRKGSPKKKGNT